MSNGRTMSLSSTLANSTSPLTSAGGDRTLPDDVTRCGVSCCRPRWLQVFASKYLFVAFFSVMEITQAVFYTYYRSVITTLERQFSVPSQTIGIVMSGKEISQILCGLVLAYYGGQGNRPRWIASGMLIVSFACMVMVSPFFLYLGHHDALPAYSPADLQKDLCLLPSPSPPSSFNGSAAFFATSAQSGDDEFNDIGGGGGGGSLLTAMHGTNLSVLDAGLPAGPCNPKLDADSVTSLALLFVGGFVAGTGLTMLTSLTFPYLDDGVTKSASALYIAILTGLRVLGPTFGSMLGGLCLRFYVTLSANPGITMEDPRWIGAWWLGFVILGAVFALGSCVVAFFPREISVKRSTSTAPSSGDLSRISQTSQQDISNNNNDNAEKPKIGGLPTALKRLLKNKILMFNGAARCFFLFGMNGFDTFQPKYLESHFHQTASGASFFSGISGNAVRLVGILAVGLVFRFWRPRAIYVNAWNIVLDIVYIGSLLMLMMLSCPTISIVGGVSDVTASTTTASYPDLVSNHHHLHAPTTSGMTGDCSANCSCSAAKFNPVCLDNRNYFSPCHAGCTNYQGSRPKNKAYFNCSCAMSVEQREADILFYLDNSSNDSSSGMGALPSRYLADEAAAAAEEAAEDSVPVATSGYCSVVCSSFTIYLIVLGLQKTLMSTRRVGRMLIILRCIDDGDKSLALALSTIMESIFAYIPCPIVYGALLDAACTMWGSNCGKQGNCWLYDTDYLRYVMHGFTIFFIVGATVLDSVVLYFCRSLSFFDEDEQHQPQDTDSESNREAGTVGKKDAAEHGCSFGRHRFFLGGAVSAKDDYTYSVAPHIKNIAIDQQKYFRAINVE